MKNPTVSVIMAVYNTKKEYLKEAIDSILNQTFTSLELIIVNDGSTNPDVDKTVKSYSDERIKYYTQPNAGAAAAMNNARRHAQGKYIAVLDSDDIALPQRFEKQVAFLDAHPEISVCGCNMKLFHEEDGKDFEVTNCPPSPKLLELMERTLLPHSSAMYRRDDFERFNIWYNPNFKICYDYELWLNARQHLDFFILPDILLRYRVCPNSLAHAPGLTLQQEVQAIHKSLLTSITDNPEIRQKIEDIFNPQLPSKKKILLPRWMGKVICLFIPSKKNRKHFREEHVKPKKSKK